MKYLAFAAALVLLTACEPAAPPPPPPKAAAAKIVERAEPVRWNPDADGFELAGKPLRAIKLWTFDESTEGFTAAGNDFVPGSTPGLRLKIVEPTLRSPRDLAVNGVYYSLVLVRLTRVKAGGGWNGALYYVTPEHGESPGFFGKPLLGADPAVGETTILVYDMGRQTVGGDDWKVSRIDQIRLDLDDRPGGEFVIHQVAIAERADLSTLLPPELRPKDVVPNNTSSGSD